MNGKRVLASAVVLLLSMMLAAPLAVAQQEEEGGALLLSTSSTTTTALVGGIILTIVLATGDSSLENYIRNNAVALEQDISTGAGATVDDLAMAFGVSEEQRPAFGRVLRQNRQALLALIDTEALDADRARAFVELVLDASIAEGVVEPAQLSAG